MGRIVLCAILLFGCSPGTRSSMRFVNPTYPLQTTGPDAMALPVDDRYRYGVVVGSVVTVTGERGCNGEVWLHRDVRTIADQRLQNMFRFPQLLPGRYELGVRCFGFQPVRQKVRVRIGHVLRAVVTMHPLERNGGAVGLAR